MTQDELNEIIKLHERWLAEVPTGQQAIFEDVDLSGASFSGANLADAVFRRVNLQRTKFNYAQLQNTEFDDVDMAQTEFRRANLFSATFINVRASDAEFFKARLFSARIIDSEFSRCDFCRVDAQHSYWQRVKLTNSSLKASFFMHAGFDECELTGTKINNIIGDGKTIKTLIFGQYITSFTATDMAIGCRQYSIPEWIAFSDKEIDAMDTSALAWWTEHKHIVLNAACGSVNSTSEK